MPFQALKLQTIFEADERVITQAFFDWNSWRLTMGFASFPALRTQERRMNRRDQLGQLFRRRFMRPRMRTDDLSRQNEDVVLIWQNIATLRQQTTSLPS